MPADRPVPAVLGLASDLFREGDRVDLDGGAGWVDLRDAEPVEVVTAFLQRADGRILLLRRSERVGSFRGHWAAVSGFLEGRPPEAQARLEILEETGLGPESVVLRSQGSLVLARAEKRMFVVHPLRFWTRSTTVRLDWEHTEFEWVDPSEIRARPTVPKLDEVWESVRGRS